MSAEFVSFCVFKTLDIQKKIRKLDVSNCYRSGFAFFHDYCKQRWISLRVIFLIFFNFSLVWFSFFSFPILFFKYLYNFGWPIFFTDLVTRHLSRLILYFTSQKEVPQENRLDYAVKYVSATRSFIILDVIIRALKQSWLKAFRKVKS